VPIGEAAARKVADKLRALSLPPEQYAALRARQAAPSAGGAIIVDAIRVEGTERVSPEVVLQVMQTQVGQPLERETIDLDCGASTVAATSSGSTTRSRKPTATRWSFWWGAA
jgi:NTE family protein